MGDDMRTYVEDNYFKSASEYSQTRLVSAATGLANLDLLCLYGVAGSATFLTALVTWAGTLSPDQAAGNWPLLIMITGCLISTLIFTWAVLRKPYAQLHENIDIGEGHLKDVTQEDLDDLRETILRNRMDDIGTLDNHILRKYSLYKYGLSAFILAAILSGLFILPQLF